MKRRGFLNAFVGAVATVAIGLKVAEAVPKIAVPEWWSLSFSVPDNYNFEVDIQL